MLLAFSSLNHSSRSWKSTSAWLTQLKTINNSSTKSTKMQKEKINSNQIHFYRCKRSPMPHGYPQAITTTLEWVEINTLKWSNIRNYLKLKMTPSQYMHKVSLKGLFYKTWQLSIKNHQGTQVYSTARWISMKRCHRVTTITKWTSTILMIRGTIQFKIHFCRQSMLRLGIQMKDLWCIMTLTTLVTTGWGKEPQISQEKRTIIKVLALGILFLRARSLSGLGCHQNMGRSKIGTITIHRNLRTLSLEVNIKRAQIKIQSKILFSKVFKVCLKSLRKDQ